MWGIPYPGEGDDLSRVEMKVSKLPAPVEDFTIALDKMGNGCVHADGLGDYAGFGGDCGEEVT